MLLSAIFAVGLGGASAFAGQLRVVVVDDTDELPIPAAQVQASCASGLVEAQTDANGEVLFDVGPGLCRIVVTSAYGDGVTIDGLEVVEGRTTLQTVKLPLHYSEQIEVVTESRRPLLRIPRGVVLTRDFVNKVPAGRDYQTAVQVAPGVAGGGNPNMAGGASDENTYVLDGANISGGESYQHPGHGPMVMADGDRLSTFATDVDTASYAVSRRWIEDGHLPPPDAVRVEEFVNAFRYGYDGPTDGHPFAIRLEAAPHPLRSDRVLLSVALAGETVERQTRPVRLTFLVDVSGSMSSPDKLPLAQQALHKLVDGLGPEDRVALVTYAGSTRVALKPAWTVDRRPIHLAIDQLSSGGSTAMGDGIGLAYGLAEEMYVDGAENRVVILTDGDANVGPATPEKLQEIVNRWAGKGITLSVVGFGTGNYKDAILERLADKGDGNYSYVDSLREADRVFGRDLGATLVTIARDVKAQIEFPEESVLAWRQIGYENRAVADEDFRDDAVDGGEIGSGHEVTALYELVLRDHPTGDLARVRVRAEPPGEEAPAVEFGSSVAASAIRSEYADASRQLRWATASATFAEMLRRSPHLAEVTWRQVLDLVDQARDRDDTDREEMRALVVRASELAGGLDVALVPAPVPVPANATAGR